MSFKKYIDEIKSQTKKTKPLIKQTRETLGSDFDRGETLKVDDKLNKRYIPPVQFNSASNFAFYGLAEEYYNNAINNIASYYPYDGTLTDKKKWQYSASFFENYVFDNEYPRTNGYVIFSSDGWGTQADLTGGYGLSSDPQYILLDGGLQVGNVVNDAGFGSNLKFGQSAGNCVEFWIKKSGYINSLTTREVILDIWNSSSIAASKGKFSVQIDASLSTPLMVEIVSGTTSHEIEISTIASGTLLDNAWHHVALNVAYGDSTTTIESYLDGTYQGADSVGTVFTAVTGNFVATVGSLVSEDPLYLGSDIGWGKLSASLDDFRFWRSTRTPKDIGIFTRQPVNGGAVSGSSNINLGVYYKFNEGITTAASIDQTILDYSGRVNNGTFIGYVSTARATGSAFVISGLASKEFKDPILYLSHPDVASYKSERILSASSYDTLNNNNLYNTLPNWMVEEDVKNSGHLKKLTQIMASTLDELLLEIKTFPLIKSMDYYPDKVAKTSFPQKALNSRGLIIGRILEDQEILSSVYDSGDTGQFLQKLEDIKRVIYNNLYNNSDEIFKTKGTPESLRNALRCFGVDNELINLSIYQDNAIVPLDDKRELYAEKYKFINFSTGSNNDAVVFPDLSATIGTPYITGTYGAASPIEARLANTYECQAFLPKYVSYNENKNVQFVGITSSIFGVHGIQTTSSADQSTQFSSDDAGFQVYAVRDNLVSKRVKFVLTSSVAAGGADLFPSLTTDFFTDSYDNETWTLAVTIKPIGYGVGDLNQALPTGSNSYMVNFRGFNVEDDRVYNSFDMSASFNGTRAIKMLSQNRKPYYGANRTNFTGSILTKSDLNIGFFRIWLDNLTNEELISHAKDPRNAGRSEPYRNFLPLSEEFGYTRVPKINSLIMNIGTDNIQTSDASGEFFLSDLSSGSYKSTSLQYLDAVLGGLYQAKGTNFKETSTNVYTSRFFTVAKTINPENFGELSGVKILTEDDIATKDILKTKLAYFTIEKSAQQALNRDILAFFASLSGFNELIGNPINKYRMEYKDLQKLATEYFSTVINKRTSAAFFEYYKWLDNSINDMLINLLPATLNGSDEIYNVIESHVLERNKYQYKLPTLEFKDPVFNSAASGANTVNYQFSHYPQSDAQSQNCYWWKYKAERDNATFNTNFAAGVITGREQILSATAQTQLRKITSPVKDSYTLKQEIHGGINFGPNKKLDYYKGAIYESSSVGYPVMETLATTIKEQEICYDDDTLVTKRKLSAGVTVGIDTDPVVGNRSLQLEIAAPFNIFSESIPAGTDTGYVNNTFNTSNPNKIVTNIHHDVFGAESDQPMQGTFTSQRVGGSDSRKIRLTDNLTTANKRPERFIVNLTESDRIITKAHRVISDPSDRFYKDPPVRAPVNIKNIKTTGSAVGNYAQSYEVVQTSGKSINNWSLADLTGIVGNNVSPYVGDSYDYPIITGAVQKSVFVERFSAPGGPDVAGGFLDPINHEFSVYNELNNRNSVVRTVLKDRLRVASFYGYESGSSDLSASLEKVQRNSRRVMKAIDRHTTVTSSVYDNGFITRAIPAREAGYSWISESLAKYLPGMFGFYDQPVLSNFVAANGFATGSDQLIWVTASLETFNPPSLILEPWIFYPHFGQINFAGYITPGVWSNLDDYHYTFSDPYTLAAPSSMAARPTNSTASIVLPSGLRFQTAVLDGKKLVIRDWTGRERIMTFLEGVAPGDSNFEQIGINGLAVDAREELADSIYMAVGSAVTASQLFLQVHKGTNSLVIEFTSTLAGDFTNQSFQPGGQFGATLQDYGFNDPFLLITHNVSSALDVNPYGGGAGSPPYGQFNTYNLNTLNNGPYGWNSWSSIHNLYKPLVRNLRKINNITHQLEPIIIGKTANGDNYIARESGYVADTEPAMVDNKPVLILASLKKGDNDAKPDATLFALPHNAQKTYFFNRQIAEALITPEQKKEKSVYEKFADFYQADFQTELNESDIKLTKYSHQIYPPQKYSFLKRSLIRDQFVQNWRNSRKDRSLIKSYNMNLMSSWDSSTPSLTNSMGFNLVYMGPNATSSIMLGDAYGPSMWCLDGAYSIVNPAGAINFSLGAWTGSAPAGQFLTIRADNLAAGGMSPKMGLIPTQSREFGYPTTTSASWDSIAAKNMTYGILRDPKNVLTQFIVSVPSGDISASFDSGVPPAPYHVYGPLLELPTQQDTAGAIDPSAFLAPWSAWETDGYGPTYYNEHKEFSELSKIAAKDYALVAEYLMSDHIEALDAGFSLDSEEVSGFSINGSSHATTISDIMSFLDGDELLNFEDIRLRNKDNPPDILRLKIETVQKLLPYEGFYPAERTVQLAALFSQSLAPRTNVAGTQPTFRTMMQPFFVPGILYNSIKAGTAVSYGYFNDSYTTAVVTTSDGVGTMRGLGRNTGNATSSFRNLKFEDAITLQPLIEGATLHDMFPHASMTMDSTATLETKNVSPYYQMAISNFFASTIDFSLRNNQLTTLISKRESDLQNVQDGDSYAMEISLDLSTSSVSGLQQGLSPLWDPLTVLGWGPAVSGSERGGGTTTANRGNDIPWRPPWCFGSATINLEWNPLENKKYKIAEIQAALTSTFGRSIQYGGVDYSEYLFEQASSLSESLNFKARIQALNFVTDPSGRLKEVKQPDGAAPDVVWAIQPKWETPFLTRNADSFYGGIWKSYVSRPDPLTNGAAFTLRIKDIPGKKSMKDLLRFRDEVSIGQISETTTISEALVCIPYAVAAGGQKLWFTRPRDQVDAEIATDKGEWYELDKLLDKYIFPPAFDWKRNQKIKSTPIGMIVKEYSMPLDKDDISLWWQNLPPKPLSNIEFATDYVEIDLKNTRMFEGMAKGTVKWVIFKVKKRSKANYFAMTAENPNYGDYSQDTLPSFKNDKFSTSDFHYNYPYDFCSLVETAKITAEVDYGKAPAPPPQPKPPQSPPINTNRIKPPSRIDPRVARVTRAARVPDLDRDQRVQAAARSIESRVQEVPPARRLGPTGVTSDDKRQQSVKRTPPVTRQAQPKIKRQVEKSTDTSPKRRKD